MQVLSRWLGCAFTAVLAGIALLLAAAFIWTAMRLATVNDLDRARAGTASARAPAYRATATAINAAHGRADSRAGGAIVRLQDDAESPRTPKATDEPEAEATAPAPTSEAVAISLPTLMAPRNPTAGKWLAGMRVPSRAPEAHRAHNLVNILLLGSDAQLNQESFIRTDTMVIVSLNLDTGTASMLSLPRDLFVYIPHGNMGRLNTAFGIGENLDWTPGRGFGLLRQTIFYNFGINVHFYARVDFSGFEAIIDWLGGVDIAVDCAYRDYYPYEDVQDEAAPSTEYRLRTLPVGYYTFDGFDALWYARTRKYTDDFDRGRRHQLLIRAIWRKARSLGLATTLPQLWAELTEVVETDIPFDVILRLMPFAINLDPDDVQNYTFRKIYHTSNWTTPDGWSVLLPNRDAVVELMQALYTPPSRFQATLAGASIAVFNASGEENWDIVASERLRWGGYNAIALGLLEDGETRPSSQLVDHVAAAKGSLVPGVLRALNMAEDQVEQLVKADRDYDYVVILGQDYESCTFGVLPING